MRAVKATPRAQQPQQYEPPHAGYIATSPAPTSSTLASTYTPPQTVSKPAPVEPVTHNADKEEPTSRMDSRAIASKPKLPPSSTFTPFFRRSTKTASTITPTPPRSTHNPSVSDKKEDTPPPTPPGKRHRPS